ncbi:unnamed protein product [Closterium sp. NIES-65]|nr:unnamed protein product [Closterium sp. NIES-65]
MLVSYAATNATIGSTAANSSGTAPQVASPAVVTPSPRGNAGASGAATNFFAMHRLPSPAAPLPAPKSATSSATSKTAGPVQLGLDIQSPRGVAALGSFQSPRGRKKPSAAQPLRTPSALARLPLPASSAAASFAASAPPVPSAASASSAYSIPVGASSISPSTRSASPSAASASPAAHSPGTNQPAENPSRNASPRTGGGATPAQVAQVGSATPSPAATPTAAGAGGVPGASPTAETAAEAVPLPLPASGEIAARAAAGGSAQPASPAGGAGTGGAGSAGGARAVFPPSPSAAPLGVSEWGVGGGGERNVGSLGRRREEGVQQMAWGFAEEGRIGEGGFGVVYKGNLPTKSGRKIPVAVKVLNAEGQQGEREWLTEVSVLTHLISPTPTSSLSWVTARATTTACSSTPLFSYPNPPASLPLPMSPSPAPRLPVSSSY